MPAFFRDPDTYRELIDAIKNRNCVVFVGAGLSVKAGYPSWETLMKSALEKLRPYCDEGENTTLKNWLDAGEFLKIASFFRGKLSQFECTEFLKKTFINDSIKPTEDHTLIVNLPFPFIITSNYDKLIEDSYSASHNNKAPIVKTYKALDLGGLNIENRFYVLYSHGHIDDPVSIVWTEQQYNDLKHNNPAYQNFFNTLLSSKILLFVGYSLRDPDLRLFRECLNTLLPGQIPPSYILMTGLTQTDISSQEENENVRVISFNNDKNDFREVTEFLSTLCAEVGVGSKEVEMIVRKYKRETSSTESGRLDKEQTPKLNKIPYKFLDCYYSQDQKWFCGRDDDEAVRELLDRLDNQRGGKQDRIIQFLGKAGIGKSSTIQALVIPKLEKRGYTCKYINCPLNLDDISVKAILGPFPIPDVKKHVVFIDHFEKVLDEYCGRKDKKERLDTWAGQLVEALADGRKVVFINTTGDNSVIHFTNIFLKACKEKKVDDFYDNTEFIEMFPMTKDQVRKTILEPRKKLKAEGGEGGELGEHLVNEMVQEYKQDQNYALTYVQAMCYYLAKKGSLGSNFKEKLKNVIITLKVGEIIKSLSQKDDRILFIEVLKRMFNEDNYDLLTPLSQDLKKLLELKTEFPEKNEF
jgi:hypothetical protein